jgi:methionyl-tRNA formyltransferase
MPPNTTSLPLPEPPRYVIVTGSNPEHKVVANKLCKVAPPIAIYVCTEPPRLTLRRLARRGVRSVLDKAASIVFRKLVNDNRARDTAYQRIFNGQGDRFDFSERVKEVGLPKAPLLRELVEKVQPDLLLVYGTSIVPNTVLQVVPLALNLHTGMSPYYRGTAGAFWPIVNNEFGRIGSTVHACTSHVDGGAIYATRVTSIVPGDDLHTVFARVVLDAAALYAQTLANIGAETQSQPTVQDRSVGREYKGADRGLRSEIRARINLRRARISK